MARNRTSLLRLAVLLAAGALVAGCGKKTPPAPVTVEGRVTHANGKPVTGLVLTLHPQEDVNKMSLPSAPLGEKDGSFRFDCIPGRYKATLAPIVRQGHAPSGPGAVPGPGPVSTPQLPGGIPQKYLTATESDLTVEVPPDGARDLVLRLNDQKR